MAEKRDFSSIMEGVNQIAALDRQSLQRFTVTKDQLKKALDSKDVPNLRKYSLYFYHTSGVYRRLVDYYANLLTFDHILLPTDKEEVYSDGAFLKAYERQTKYIDNSQIKADSNEIVRNIIRDGAYFGYERDLNGNFTFQHLPAEFCRSRFKIAGVATVEFDYSFFNQFRGDDLEEILEAFPEEMQQGFLEYLKDRTNNRWGLLNPDFARAHMLGDEVPIFASVLEDVIDYSESKRIQKIKDELNIYKIVVQKIPLDDDGNLTFEMPELKQFHQNLRKMVSNSNVDVVTTPCDVDLVDLQDTSQQGRDSVETAKESVYSNAGTASLLFGASKGSGSIGLRESQRVDEMLVLTILSQFEAWYKNRLSKIPGKYNFVLLFPPITYSNREEMVDMYTNAATFGFGTKLLALAAMGISQTESNALLAFENNFLELNEKMIPTKSAHTQPGNEDTKPEKDDKDLSDEGASTRDANKNGSDS